MSKNTQKPALVESVNVTTPVKYDLIPWRDAAGGPVNIEELQQTGLTADELRDMAVETPSPESTMADHLYRAAMELEAALLKLKGRDTAAPGYAEHYFGIGSATQSVVEALAREMIDGVLGVSGTVPEAKPKPAHSALVNRMMPGKRKRKVKGSEVRQ